MVAKLDPANDMARCSVLLQREGHQKGQYDEAWTNDFLNKASDFDKRMNDIVVESGILAGAPAAAFQDAGTL